MKDLMQTLIEEMKVPLSIQYEADRPADVPRLWVNPTKFRNITGFTNEMDFREGLRETIAYYTELNKQGNLLEEIQLENWKK
jgi:UDP-glucose 4-epimerase